MFPGAATKLTHLPLPFVTNLLCWPCSSPHVQQSREALQCVYLAPNIPPKGCLRCTDLGEPRGSAELRAPAAALGASMTQHLLCFQPELFIRRFSVLFCLLQEILCLIK